MGTTLLSVLVAVSLLINGCSAKSSSGDDAGIALKGSLSAASFSSASISPFKHLWHTLIENIAFACTTRVDKLWALPMFNGEFNPQAMGYVKRVSVGSDGSFTLDLDTKDWGVVMVDSSQSTDLSKIVGYVTMTAGSDGLQKFALGSATSTIDLGTLTANGTETTSSNTASTNATKFGFTEAQLSTMAKSDDTLKVLKNIFANYNADTGVYVTIKPFYLWYTTNAASVIKNAFSTPSSTVGNFAGYLYYFNSNNTAIDYAAVCANTQALALYPPSTVTNMSMNVTFNASTPLTSTGSSSGSGSNYCGRNHIYIRDDSGLYQPGASYQFNYGINGEYLKPPIPSGNWTLKAGSTTIATFDGQLGSPFIADDTAKPIIFIPSVKVTTASGVITNVEIKWYLRNTSSGSYEEVTDTTMLGQLKNLAIELTQYTGSTVEERNTTFAAGSYSYAPTTYSWGFVGDTSGSMKIANSVAVGFDMNGVAYRFEFRQN